MNKHMEIVTVIDLVLSFIHCFQFNQLSADEASEI